MPPKHLPTFRNHTRAQWAQPDSVFEGIALSYHHEGSYAPGRGKTTYAFAT